MLRAHAVPTQRRALPADSKRISELMRTSVLALFPHLYDERQTASAVVHIAHLDMTLIEDALMAMLLMPEGVMVEGVAMQRPIA